MTPLARAARALVLKESGTDSFDALEPELQEQVIESVKAVLEAIREPSDAMLDAGDHLIVLRGEGVQPISVYHTMIDAAIAEGA
jgi:hypothetical protein